MGPKFGIPVKFAVVGVANTVVGLAAIYLCKWLLGFNDALANITGYTVGLIISFLLNRGWTFGHSARCFRP
jgi:putative flippase GtrA